MGKYIGMVSSLLSILVMIFTDISNLPTFKWVLTVVSIGGLVLALALEVHYYFKGKPKKYNKEENIEYMKRIISNGGKVVVFAGSLSWVNNDDIKQAMLNKKRKLHLCVEESAPHIDEFKAAGVNVYTYGSSGFSPKTRFTVMRKGTTNEKIAITSIEDTDKAAIRWIYEVSKDDKDFKNRWIGYAAEDLFNLAKLLEDRS